MTAAAAPLTETATPSRTFAVRMDADTFTSLRAHSERDGRSVSQVIRFALRHWTTLAAPTCPAPATAPHGSTADPGASIAVTYKMPAGDAATFTAHHQRLNMTRSEAVRCAVRTWIASGHAAPPGLSP